MPHIQLPEISLYYEIHGAGEPVLFLHGLGSSTTDWEFQRDVFAANYQVVLVDARGHGRSQKPPGPNSVPIMTQDIIALIKALDLGAVNVVGLSMGGMTGLQLALDAPELVKRLVVINAIADLRPKSLRDHLLVWQRLAIVRLFNMRGMGKFLANRLFPLDSQAEARPIFVERWAKNDKTAYVAAFKGLVGWSVLDRLPAIQCPVLFLAAQFDYSSVEDKETAVSLIPNATLQIIPNSRHASTVDAPEVVNDGILQFLSESG
ncbi:MAG: alpha/beta fold hydrolase [Chloroflexi bacterium]|nr:MAG: alpha/beta fold hydrolase [Chloroflexota bacterium]